MIDGLLADLGIDGGALSKMGGLIREARDMQAIAKETARDGAPAAAANPAATPGAPKGPGRSGRGRRGGGGSPAGGS